MNWRLGMHAMSSFLTRQRLTDDLAQGRRPSFDHSIAYACNTRHQRDLCFAQVRKTGWIALRWIALRNPSTDWNPWEVL